MKSRKGIGGRPRHGNEVKAAYLNMRTDFELRVRVEASAKRRGLSITQEVERMVRRQLDTEVA
jgi:hypothetical protein